MTRILLVEDQPIVRSGIRALLEGQSELSVLGEAPSAEEAMALYEKTRPDLVLTDIGLPGQNGIWLTRQITRAGEGKTQVVILSVYRDPEYVHAALDAGARGYVLKWAAADVLLQAVGAVASGKAFIDPEVAFDALQEHPASPLSPREREVLVLLCEGCTTRDIASRLNLSPKTVETHRSHVMDKLQIFDVAGLVKYAAKQGLIQI